MPRSSGREGIELIRARAPRVRILAMSASERIELIRDALDAGAAGYVTKLAPPQTLRDAVVQVHGGGTFISKATAERVMRPDFDLGSPAAGAGKLVDYQPLLSPRENDVLRLIAKGHTDAAVATELGIRLRTVQNHLARIRTKTRLRRRSELAAWAMRHGML
jgi:DNA-binding NarL/FixJ family response regulator